MDPVKPAPAEQLSWKVVCDREPVAHHRLDHHRFAPDRFCVDPRPAQPQAPQGHCGAHDVLHARQHGCLNWKACSQAPAPSLDARGRARALLVELRGDPNYEPECDVRRWEIASAAFAKALRDTIRPESGAAPREEKRDED